MIYNLVHDILRQHKYTHEMSWIIEKGLHFSHDYIEYFIK